jgi:hypothetical protein
MGTSPLALGSLERAAMGWLPALSPDLQIVLAQVLGEAKDTLINYPEMVSIIACR